MDTVTLNDGRSVPSIMYELGKNARRFFKMSESSFWKLHALLEDKINASQTERDEGRTRNGPIHSSVHLSIALRHFYGGDPLDIALVHRVSPPEVVKSVPLVVDAIHSTKDFDSLYPKIHQAMVRSKAVCIDEF